MREYLVFVLLCLALSGAFIGTLYVLSMTKTAIVNILK